VIKTYLHFLVIILFGVGSLLTSCQTESAPDEEALATADTAALRDIPLVEIVPLRRGTFAVQIISNGQVRVGQRAELQFRTPGIIERVLVRNGESVQAGQLLAVLANDREHLDLRKAELQLAESRVEIDDLLITQGGKRGDSTSVSPQVYAFIKLRSGFARARLAVEEAKLALEHTSLRAPMSGVVANLTLSAHNPTPTDKPFCTLLDRRDMRVVCPILETELATVRAGQAARVEPVGQPDTHYAARVLSLNPIVNEEGFVEATLRLSRPDARLLAGMNVRVVIEKNLPNQLVVPKTAVVERNGRKVVFTYEDGLAKWHYVTTGPENSTEMAIAEGLEGGEQVIVAGNLSLGHDAAVQLKSKN